MATLISDQTKLLKLLREQAALEHLPVMTVTSARLPPIVGERLQTFVADGRHGDMQWMADTVERRVSPDAMWPDAKSALMFALPYTPDIDPMARLVDSSTGVISIYGLNRDYHDVFKGKLKRLANWLARTSCHEVKVFVDTAPVMEKPLAQQSGMGWQGKHTNLVSRDLGSWFFIGSILTTLELPTDAPEVDHCGSCRNCLDVCPTNAFPAPYQLDARRCISYLTIEHKGPIPTVFRKAMGNRIYGCDDCLAVCPWNKFASTAHELKLKARADLIAPALIDLLQLDDAEFRKLFSGSPVKRIGRDRFIRNCLIAAGNSGDTALIDVVISLVEDNATIVRGAAVWAARQLIPSHVFNTLSQNSIEKEIDDSVLAEWQTV
jgi:epoxyqueuosine reductase